MTQDQRAEWERRIKAMEEAEEAHKRAIQQMLHRHRITHVLLELAIFGIVIAGLVVMARMLLG